MALTGAEKIYNEFILRFAFSAHVHHDPGGEFEKKLFHHLQWIGGVASV